MTMVNAVYTTGVQLFEPRCGYDLIAPYYELWRWFRFWRLNEAPIILQWLKSLPLGLGLDAGSGTGPYIPDITALGHRCIAFDLSWQMLRINREKSADHTHTSSVFYSQGHIGSLPFRDSQFDWVLCSRVLSHMMHLTPVLREFTRVLKHGGECLLSDVHPNHPYTHVAIPTNGGKVAIETHKHSLEDLKKAISEVQYFEVVSLDEYYLTDLLSMPSKEDFEKLYQYSNTAIFYVYRLRKY
jgi:ubiquinone/menaquinone biosynthesis C-methylase UbiE